MSITPELDYQAKQDGRTVPGPFLTLNDQLPELRRPFTPAAVKIKPQTITGDKSKGLVTYYIDSRLLVERLNAVVGAGGWRDTYRLLVEGREAVAVGLPVECSLTVLGITKTDVGQIEPGEMDNKAWKAAYSDAFKRAGVKFGIGAFLYNLPNVWVEVRIGSNGKVQGFSEAGIRAAKDAYVRWLASPANIYGDPLDHGDTEEARASEEELPEEPPFDPGKDLLPGAPRGASSWKDLGKLMQAVDPTLDWRRLAHDILKAHFNVQERAQLSPPQLREFGIRLANLVTALHNGMGGSDFPPPPAERIRAVASWAFDGLAVEPVYNPQPAGPTVNVPADLPEWPGEAPGAGEGS